MFDHSDREHGIEVSVLGQVERVSCVVGDVHAQRLRHFARRSDDLRPVLDSSGLVAVGRQPQKIRTTPSADLQNAAARWDDALQLAVQRLVVAPDLDEP